MPSVNAFPGVRAIQVPENVAVESIGNYVMKASSEFLTLVGMKVIVPGSARLQALSLRDFILSYQLLSPPVITSESIKYERGDKGNLAGVQTRPTQTEKKVQSSRPNQD